MRGGVEGLDLLNDLGSECGAGGEDLLCGCVSVRGI